MKLNKNLILDVAETFIIDKGFEKTTLSDISKNLNVTHAALYKYYENKEDLFENLALRWLTISMDEIFEWQPVSSPNQDLHEWLWLLTTTKKELYQSDPEMFFLYTRYIEQNTKLVNNHLNNLAIKVEQIDSSKNGMAVILAFTFFHNPYFSERWNSDNYEEKFEEVWQLIVNK